MTAAFNYSVAIESCGACITCGVEIFMPANLRKQKFENRTNFYCVNGHPQHYVVETKAEKLQRELDAERKKREWAEQSARAERELRDKTEKKLKRERKRVSNGVCPCCNRHFTNVERHMKTKHPDFADPPASAAPKGGAR